MEEIHLFNSDEKLELYGYGEWVEEPDEVYFMYEGFNCKIKRNPYMGNLCGYVEIPKDILYVDEDMLDVYCGITYSQMEDDNKHWIGFDCAHGFDVIPGLEKRIKNYDEIQKIQEYVENFKKTLDIFLPEKTYKNINFVMEECKNLINQLITNTLDKGE